MPFGSVLGLVGLAAPVLAGAEGEFVVFDRDSLPDAVHLLSGVAGLVAGYYVGGASAKQYDVVLGIAYALVTVLGFALGGPMAGLLAANTADNVRHLPLALVFLGTGFVGGDR